MSASDKKKLRKEQNMTAMTEKQQQASKEAKKLKTYTLTFIVIMALVVAIMVGVLVRNPVAGAISRGTHSVTIGNHELSTADFSYYYVDAVVSHYNQYSQYGDYAAMYAMWMEGIDFSKPFDQQVYDEKSGETWADHYINEAIENAKSTYALYDKAINDSEFKLSEDDQAYLDDFDSYMDMYASMYGYDSAAGYLRNYYGVGANVKTFKTYNEVSLIASEYYNHHKDSLEYKDADFRAYEKDKFTDYSTFDYAIFTVNSSDYLKGGTTTKDENGKETTTYSDDEKKAALEAAKLDADAIAGTKVEEDKDYIKTLNAFIITLEKYKAKKPSFTEKSELGSKLTNEDIEKWLTNGERKANDITVIEKYTTSTDKDGKETKTVDGYYVVLFQGREDNQMKMENVRHILFKFKGGTKDDKTGETTYSDDEKKAAKAAAEKILEEWNLLDKKSAEAFGELAKKHSDDGSKSAGGLIENIHPGQMVEPFENWCFDEGRKEGEVGMVETEFGYHLIYYVGESKLTYRDSMIEAQMITEAMEKWEKELTDAMTATKVNLKGIETDMTMG